MLKYLLIGLFVYVAYKLVVNIVIPVYRTSRQMRQKFQQMQEKMNQAQQQRQAGDSPFHNRPADPATSVKKEIKGDYIDFEEVK